MLFDLATATDALEDLLDFERRLILDGKLDGLARTSRQKAQLLARVSAAPDTAPLERIRGKAERNQELLRAALLGLEAAKRRIATLAQEDVPLRTYGADGAAADLGKAGPKPGINHRA
jgi:hypothetical protein